MELLARRFDNGQLVRLRLEEGKIAEVSESRVPANTTIPPWVSPGWVDIQVNGYDGQEFSSLALTPALVARIVRRHYEFGVTRLCPTLTTEGFDVLAHGLRTIAAACEADAAIAASVPGIHVEGPYIAREDGPRGAHPLAHCRPPCWDEFSRLQEAAGGRIRLLTLSPEYEEAPEFIRRAVASGVVISIGHTGADSTQIRAAVDAGATLSTHLGNGAHRQLRRHPNYLWDQMAEDRLSASLIVDGHHLPAEVVKSMVRAKTPERIILVSDESGLAGLPPGRYPSSGCELEILPDGKLVIAGQDQLLAGASAPLGVGIANVIRFAGVSLATAVDMATTHPARLLGLWQGKLEAGAPADLVLFDFDERGESSEPAKLEVRGTLRGGELVYGKSTTNGESARHGTVGCEYRSRGDGAPGAPHQ
ncbi:MAG: amidohydrolase family protein [Pirellulales bacterium]|nr:amidohydrolase family protein [Pirellulales bacterium]